MKILHLTIKRKWFELIAAGKKPFEYRENKPYWISRIQGKRYDEIWFYVGGYFDREKFDFMRIKWNSWTWAINELPINGEEFVGARDFAIDVTEVLEVKRSKHEAMH